MNTPSMITASLARRFVALDLEFTQPSAKIIQVGIAIGSYGQSEEEWTVRQWLLDPQEPISEFITGLTGISDADIAQKAVSWEQMVSELGTLIYEEDPFTNPITWGGGDSVALLSEIRARGMVFPYFGRRWVDVKTLYTFLVLAQGKKPAQAGLRSAMGRHGLKFLGTPHRADADAFNTLRLFFRLLERQASLEAVPVIMKCV